jgi:hypothetical protein
VVMQSFAGDLTATGLASMMAVLQKRDLSSEDDEELDSDLGGDSDDEKSEAKEAKSTIASDASKNGKKGKKAEAAKEDKAGKAKSMKKAGKGETDEGW